MAGRLIVAGAGMAGLAAAVRAVELGAAPQVYEKGARTGGSMRLSSGVIWRHAEWADFRAECPEGDPGLQRLVWDRLDEAIEWLRSLGAPVVRAETGNPRTVGARFDPVGLTETLVARLPVGSVVFESAPLGLGEATVLATGGFGASRELVARYVDPAGELRLRGSPWSTGDGLVHGLGRGAALTSGMGEFYGRNMPAGPWGERDYVPAAQLYARYARIFDETGVEFFHAGDVSWSEIDVVQATARRPNARAYYLLEKSALGERVAGRAVAEIVHAAPREARVDPGDLPFEAPDGTVAAVHVAAAITHTIGGLRLDDEARVVDSLGVPIEGLYAAGADAGGVATGGYASGLAQALVLGLVAAESAVADR